MVERPRGGGLYMRNEDGTLTKLEGPMAPRLKARLVKRRPPAPPVVTTPEGDDPPADDDGSEGEVNDA